MYLARLSAPPLIASSKLSVVLRSLVLKERLPLVFEFSFFGFAISTHFHTQTYLTRLDIQPYQNALRVREIADDLSNRLRQLAHERRDSKYLIAAREHRVLH